MIRINLLPHREEKIKQRRKAFYALLVLGGISGLLVVMLFAGFMVKKISDQNARNNLIKTENTKLDGQIKQVATLKEEIQALKARQQAVEDLQADRNQPVYLMNELVQQTPEGIYLKGFKQEGLRIVLNGYAQSNERVAEYLRNMSNNSSWLERPDLVEIRAVTLGQGKDLKNVSEFSINVGIKRPRDKEQAAASGPSDGSASKTASNGDAAKSSASGSTVKPAGSEDAAKAAAGKDAAKPAGNDTAKSSAGDDKTKPSTSAEARKP